MLTAQLVSIHFAEPKAGHISLRSGLSFQGEVSVGMLNVECLMLNGGHRAQGEDTEFTEKDIFMFFL